MDRLARRTYVESMKTLVLLALIASASTPAPPEVVEASLRTPPPPVVQWMPKQTVTEDETRILGPFGVRAPVFTVFEFDLSPPSLRWTANDQSK